MKNTIVKSQHELSRSFYHNLAFRDFLFLRLFALTIALSLCGCSGHHSIEGEIFIVTKGRENVRLALVPVSIFEEASVRPKIDAYLRDLTKMQQETAAKLKDVNSTLSVQRYMTDQTKHPEPEYLKNLEQSKQLSSELTASTGGLRLLNTLSNPVETITTNSDGRFAFKNLRNRNYILVAKSERTVGSSEELYYWIVTVNPSKLTGKQVLLSNNNVFSKVPDANILVQYQ